MSEMKPMMMMIMMNFEVGTFSVLQSQVIVKLDSGNRPSLL